MDDAVRAYAAYSAGPDAWALGRFVVPVGRLSELCAWRATLVPPTAAPWRLSVLLPSRADGEREAVDRSALTGVVVASVELRIGRPEDVATAASRQPPDVQVFYEVPIDHDPGPLVSAIARAGGLAKVRTGGVTADAFPTARDLAGFIIACVRARVAFKATAGLHHPFRAAYRLTYEPDSPHGEMFGFLNVLLGAAFARDGLDGSTLADLLDERDASAWRFTGGGVEWRGRSVDLEALTATRATLALSFGSCSFRDPLDELHALGLL